MARTSPSTQRVLLFDGHCGFCRRWCDWARRRGAEAVIQFRPCQDERALRSQANISDADCGHAAFLVELTNERVQAVYRAAAATNGVLALLPGTRNIFWRLLGRLYRIPGVRQLEDVGYRWIARNRHRFGADTCQRSSP